MTDTGAAHTDAPLRWDVDRPLPLHELVYLVEGDEVTIGRQDTDSYGVFPADGAEVVRRLADGQTIRRVTDWYEDQYGERLDIDDLLEALDELGFIRTSGEPPAESRVRWRRLGIAVLSPPALTGYGAIVILAVIAMVRRPDLVPHYRNIFFTDYYTIVQVTLFLAAIPLLFVHEMFHALGGRRLGLRTRLAIGRRLYFIVLETSLDGLVAVPRRKRYLPILAGVMVDIVGVATLTIAADLTREPDGTLSLAGRICLAVAFAALLRVVWQFYFYLRTDMYALIHTVLGCVDLHTTATRMLRNRVNRLLGRRDRLVDETDWHPVDRRAARWYSWLIVAGYTMSIGTLVLAGLPILYEFTSGVLARFSGGAGVSPQQQLDAIVFGTAALLQILVFGWLMVRDRRRQRRERRLNHVIA
jgi:hypothetical protein